MSGRACSLCGGAAPAGRTVCYGCAAYRAPEAIAERQVGADAATALGRAKEDARMFGVGFVVDGKRVSPQSVVVVREPGAGKTATQVDAEAYARSQANERAFHEFWLREGPSLAWDEDRKRAARRIWDAARKGGA